MPLNELGQKVACEPCIRGHRSSKCRHENDRPMLQVKRPGRPLSSTCAHKAKNLDCECPPRNVTITAAIPKNKSCVCGGGKTASNDIQRVNSKGAISKNGKKSFSRRDSHAMSKVEDQTPTLSSSRTSSSTSLSMERTPSSSSYTAGNSLSQTDSPKPISQQGRGLQAPIPAATVPHSCCLPQHSVPIPTYTPQVDILPQVSCISQPCFFSEDPDLTAPLPCTLHPYHHDHSTSMKAPTIQYNKLPTDSYGVDNGLLMDSNPMSPLDNRFAASSCCSAVQMPSHPFSLDNGFEMPKSNGLGNQQYPPKDMSLNQLSMDQTNGMPPNFQQIHALGMPQLNGNGIAHYSDGLNQSFMLNPSNPSFMNGSHNHNHFRFQYPEGYGGSDRPLTEEDWRAAHSSHAFCVDSTTTDMESEVAPAEEASHPETQHLCSCGDSCQCWACPAHPFNEHTLGRLRDAAAHSFCNEYEASSEDADGVTSPDPTGLSNMQGNSGFLYVKYDFSNIMDPHAHHHHSHNHDAHI